MICTCNRPLLLERLLISIQRQRTSLIFETIVVDNQPETDSLASLEDRFRDVRWGTEPRRGLSRARNAGIRLATAPALVFVDDDMDVASNWLEALMTPIRDEGFDVVVGPAVPLSLETEAERLFEAYGGHGHASQRLCFDRSWLSAQRLSLPLWQAGPLGNSSFRRSALEDPKVGAYDEALGVGTPAGSSEDLYQAYKILRAGYRILLEPSASVLHAHRETLPELERQLCAYRRGEVCFCLLVLFRHRDPRALAHLLWWIPAWRLLLFLKEVRRRIRGERMFSFKMMGRELLAYLSGPAALFASIKNRKS